MDGLKETLSNGTQILALIHGCGGGGKTTVSKFLQQHLGLKCLYTTTTGCATALYKSDTINTALKLGRNIDDPKQVKVPDVLKRKEITTPLTTIDYHKLLLIDEISMMSPILLTRIDARLRNCLTQRKFSVDYTLYW